MECGLCTVCCRLPSLPEFNKPALEMCKHCDGLSCKIYERRPQACREFECAYYQTKNANVAMRPDHSGVLFERVAEDIMFGLLDPKSNYYPHLNGQIDSFLKEGINVVINNRNKLSVFHLDDEDPASILTRLNNIAEKAEIV